MEPNRNYYLFLDLETTGLNPNHDQIAEFVAALYTVDGLTDACFQFYGSSAVPLAVVHRVLHVKQSVWDVAHHVVRDMHTANGLITETIESKVCYGDVEDAVCGMLNSLGIEPGSLVLAGSGVHFDRRFIEARMPDLYDMFHYSHLDVSSVRKFLRDAYAAQRQHSVEYLKRFTHRAKDDVQEAVAEYIHQMRCVHIT